MSAEMSNSLFQSEVSPSFDPRTVIRVSKCVLVLASRLHNGKLWTMFVVF